MERKIHSCLAAGLTFFLFSCSWSDPGSPSIDQETNRVLGGLVNDYREQNHRFLYAPAESLARHAQEWAQEMARRGKLIHSDYRVRENIAYGYATPEQVFSAWRLSDGHRGNLLAGDVKFHGYGLAFDSNDRPYWCALFSSRFSGRLECDEAGEYDDVKFRSTARSHR